MCLKHNSSSSELDDYPYEWVLFWGMYMYNSQFTFTVYRMQTRQEKELTEKRKVGESPAEEYTQTRYK